MYIPPRNHLLFNISIGSPFTTGRSRVMATADAAAIKLKKKTQRKTKREKNPLLCFRLFYYALLFTVAQVWRAFNFMRSYNTDNSMFNFRQQRDDGNNTGVSRAVVSSTYAKSTAAVGTGFCFVSRFTGDLRHLFEKKQHPDTRHPFLTFSHKTHQRPSTTTQSYTDFPGFLVVVSHRKCVMKTI